MKRQLLITLLVCTPLCGISCQAAEQEEASTPDALLFLDTPTRPKRFRNMADTYPTRVVRRSATPYPLPSALRDFSTLNYRAPSSDDALSLSDFIAHNKVAGLLILKDGKILLEQYAMGNDDSSLWVSFSVAKSVTSLLYGAAIKDGYIKSVDEKVTAYLPRLKGSSYDEVSIRHVLQMASGVAWDETYDDPNSDVNSTSGDYLNLVATLATKPRVAPAGTKFNYNTGETNLAGAILRAAIGNNLSTYLEAKIWQRFGMGSDANWLLDARAGGELGGCCISATLRDYGRIGLYALEASKGNIDQLPQDWIGQSTTPSQGAAYYGYLWWLTSPGAFTALGIYGQTIHVVPKDNLIIITHGLWDTAVGQQYSAHRGQFFEAVIAFTR